MHRFGIGLVRVAACLLLSCAVPIAASAQTDSGTVSGRVADPTGSILVGAQVRLIDVDRNAISQTVTNSRGLYIFPGVHPGRYRMEVEAKGFKVVNVTGLTVNTQANLEQNFLMAIGSVSESITVEAKASEISTSVNTVVDRQFVENIPLNGRSFQSLIQLAPGVVVTPTSDSDSGQFSVNGQRASANYFTVDGVSANIGASFNPASTQNASGSMPGLSVLGGTNNLVSVDALQEFRIQTSTYAPEFGRVPGAQVSLETRSGTNQYHGTLFEYLRNDVLDASNWFNGAVSAGTPPLKKSQERQNDFGGVFGGPIFQDKTFFFFSYEQEILRLPRSALTEVPSLAVRQSPATPAAILPVLNAYPLPNQSPSAAETANGLAPFSASFSDPSTLKAASLRIDHRIGDHLSLFARYNYSPSELLTRVGGVLAINDVTRFNIKTETATLGAVWSPAVSVSNDLRFNYSWNRADGSNSVDAFGGAIVPPDSVFLPAPFSTNSAVGAVSIASAAGLRVGPLVNELQRQVNVVDGLSLQKKRHSIKFGIDYRRLSPNVTPPDYFLSAVFLNVPTAVLLRPLVASVEVASPVTILFHNLGVYAQDTWAVTPRLSATWGVRWDIDFAPTTAHSPGFLALANIGDPTTLSAAPAGTPVFQTQYSAFAPRVGATYLLSRAPGHETMLRGGFGVFYDLATQQAADIFSLVPVFPFGASKFCSAFFSQPACGGGGLSFPLSPGVVQPPPVVSGPTQPFIGFDPGLKLPYTLQWNVAMEQSLGKDQSVSATYLGALGRRLIQQEEEFAPADSSRLVTIIGGHATSDYHALQLQFRRQMIQGLQVLAAYAWSHSIDTASSSSLNAELFSSGLSSNLSRGPSDFDVRHSYSAGLRYALPGIRSNQGLKAITGGWALDSMLQGRSATPVDVSDLSFNQILGSSVTTVRPDRVPGQPLYLTGAACGSPCPGGKALNPDAFVDPPSDPVTGLPLRQGNLGRNALRGFAAFQWDMAVSRTFVLPEKLRLQLRAEFFNILNNPNFANPAADISGPFFGRSTQTLNQGLNGASVPGGGFSPLYQIGGPRSGQLALRFSF